MIVENIQVRLMPQPRQEVSNKAMWFYGTAKCDVGGVTIRAIKIKYFLDPEGKKTGFFLSYPQQKGSDGVWRPLFFTNTKESRDELTAAILAAAHNAKVVTESTAAPTL